MVTPLAVELTLAIHGGDLDALRRLLDERPDLASVRIIGPSAELSR
jgi:hypothetical protein